MKPYDPNDQEDRGRLMIAVVVSLVILLGYQFLVAKPRQEALEAQRQQEQAQQAAAALATPTTQEPAVPAVLPRAQIVAEPGTARLEIRADKIRGSLPLKGARLDDVLLNAHYTTVERTENVSLLSPVGTQEPYYVESGWVSSDQSIALPGTDTVWQRAAGSPAAIVGGGPPVRLVWDNGQGLEFQRDISLDENYLFKITQRVINRGGQTVSLNGYYLSSRHAIPYDYKGFFVLHEGPLWFINGDSEEPSYKDLASGDVFEKKLATGWLGITDKYWMVTLLPDPKTAFNARMTAFNNKGTAGFQADALLPAQTVAPGTSVEESVHVYVGVKELDIIQSYNTVYGFDRLDLSIDFGIWYLITKPFYLLLHYLTDSTGDIAIAILLMTLIVRLAVFPLANKSFRSMAKMRVVAPRMKELQERYKGDKAGLQMAIFELYKKEDVNPFSGCWPMLVQIPIFFALYKVILISIELRHAPFFNTWVHDLSAPDPTSLFNLFGAIPWTPPQPLMIGAWPVLFCLSMVIQKRISPPMADPMQEKLQTWFPYIVTIMLAHFSVGLVIYWTWSNVFGILQQWYILNTVGDQKTSLIHGHDERRKKKKSKKKAHAADDADNAE